MKALAISASIGLLSLLAWAAVALSYDRVPGRDLGSRQPFVELTRSVQPEVTIDLAGRFVTRSELYDPRAALPSWHEFPRVEAVSVRHEWRACGNQPSAPVTDRALVKALEWHDDACRSPADARKKHVGTPPHMAPSGFSYARLALELDPAPSDEWIRENKRYFHVRELALLDAQMLDDADRALAELPSGAWLRVMAGDSAVLSDRWFGLVEYDSAGPKQLRLYTRNRWNAFAAKAGVALETSTVGTCSHPATPVLCFRSLTFGEAHVAGLRAWLVASLLLLTGSVIGLVMALVRSRQLAARDRVLVLRTLTHEIRTPATSLNLDLEPLHAAFDRMPEDCQEPLLRISDSVARLDRAIQLSARYLALFDEESAGKGVRLDFRTLPSTAEYFESLREQWPEVVELVQDGGDGRLRTDPEWLAVALDNLVHNAERHGKPPVRVTWKLGTESLRIRVSDAGRTKKLKLGNAAHYFSNPGSRGGLGLGLAIVDRIAALFGGSLRHDADPTCFEIEIPNRAGRPA